MSAPQSQQRNTADARLVRVNRPAALLLLCLHPPRHALCHAVDFEAPCCQLDVLMLSACTKPAMQLQKMRVAASIQALIRGTFSKCLCTCHRVLPHLPEEEWS